MQELHDVPLFFSLHNIAGTVKCTSPSLVTFRSAVLNAGYRISSTHVNPLGIKSDAPWDVIWDIMRCWVSLGCSYIYHKPKSASRVKYEFVDVLPYMI
jgi:tRNA (guanine26-N2/guanine27-N2)-dimethyltransferase